MRKALAAVVATAAVAIAASPASATLTGHELTTTVHCTGGTLYVVDGNAYDGQVVAQTTWNTVNQFGSICYVDPPSS